jgi:methylthioribose-1-phosphate isomerase
MPVRTIEWVGGVQGKIKLIDQTLLPTQYKTIYCKTLPCIWESIKKLRVRGAPAIGIAAGYGTVLGIQKSKARTFTAFYKQLKKVTDYLGSSRPTAVNLFWALDRMLETARTHKNKPIAEIKRILLSEAHEILEEDQRICRAIGEHGAKLIKDGAGVLTHCNAGGLATGGYGTALAVMFRAKEKGKKFRVYSDETRPLLQGARLTVWELMQEGIDAVLICDSMAAQVMKEKKVNLIVVGADRIAANGDTANKIGTYSLAVLAKGHGIPFYVAAPSSTFDLNLASGEGIPIEQRGAEEVTHGFGKRTAPKDVSVYCPAFDVTPAKFITGIITEKGIIERPNKSRIRKVLGKK